MEDILKKLIEYPTISESSNINLMSYIDVYLKKFGIKGKLIQGEKNQFNYHCMIGPNKDGDHRTWMTIVTRHLMQSRLTLPVISKPHRHDRNQAGIAHDIHRGIR